MIDPFYQLWFAVRYVHVAAVALLAGGALLLALSYLTSRRSALAIGWSIASTYEWAFWALIGIVAVTGISNLGLKGEGLLDPATSWGRALTTKFVAVLTFLVASLVRSDFVIRCAAAPPATMSDRARVSAGVFYAVTAVMILGVMWLGLGLAHGRY